MIRLAPLVAIIMTSVTSVASAAILPQRPVPAIRTPVVGGAPMFFDADGAPVSLADLEGLK